MSYIKEMRKLIGHATLFTVGCGVILERDGRILLQHRVDEENWCIPGGMMEIGETFEEAAIRETYEETNLVVRDLQLFGVNSLSRSLESLDKLAKLNIKIVYPGHGIGIDAPLAMIDMARTRLGKWMSQPEKVYWHACKRIFSFSLIIQDGIAKERVVDYLMGCGWFHDFARHAFQEEPKDFVKVLLDEMIRSGAAVWKEDVLVATAPYEVPDPHWLPKRQNLVIGEWETIVGDKAKEKCFLVDQSLRKKELPQKVLAF